MPSPLSLKDFDQLLLIKPSSLGDIIHTLPALSVLHENAPHLNIHWVVNEEWQGLLEGNSCLQAIHPFPRSQMRGAKAPLVFRNWIKNFRNTIGKNMPLVIDFQGLFRSAFIARFGTKAKHIIGFAHAREGARHFYTQRIGADPNAHAIAQNLSLLQKSFSLPSPPLDQLQYHLPAGEVLPLEVEEKINSAPYLLLHPFARGNSKSLTVEQTLSLITQLPNMRVVLVGKSNSQTSDTITEMASSNCLNLLNQTSLPQLLHLIHKAHTIVTVDSAPTHLAAAIHPTRTFSLHSWTDPRKVGPLHPEAWVLKYGKLLQMKDLKEQVWLAEDRKRRHSKEDPFSNAEIELVKNKLIEMAS